MHKLREIKARDWYHLKELMTNDFSGAPFHLDAAAQEWAGATMAGLSADQKLRQLFNLRIAGHDGTRLVA